MATEQRGDAEAGELPGTQGVVASFPSYRVAERARARARWSAEGRDAVT